MMSCVTVSVYGSSHMDCWRPWAPVSLSADDSSLTDIDPLRFSPPSNNTLFVVWPNCHSKVHSKSQSSQRVNENCRRTREQLNASSYMRLELKIARNGFTSLGHNTVVVKRLVHVSLGKLFTWTTCTALTQSADFLSTAWIQLNFFCVEKKLEWICIDLWAKRPEE